MKFNHFFTRLSVALIAAASFFSCVQEEVLGDPSVTISESTLSFSAQEDAKIVELTSTLDWKLKGYTEDVKSWLSVTPDEGSASNKPVTITVAVLANAGKDRSVTIEFYGDKVHTASLTINQAGSQLPGDGSLENPYSATEARAVALALDSGTETSVAYYVHGFVKKFASKHEDGMNSFGNASFYFTDDATLEGEDFEAYQVYAPGNVKFTSLDQIKIGDEVIVYGKLTNYNGTPETVGKGAAYVYSINGETGSNVTPPDPSTVEQITCQQFIDNADPSTTYRLVGKITSSVNTNYCSFDMNDGTATVVVWTVNNKDEWKDVVKKDGTVTVRGKYLRYEKDGNVKHEMVDAYIEKFEDGEAPEPPANIIDATVAEFLAAPVSEQYYRLSGTVGGSINLTYGNFDLTDATGTVYVYGLSNIADVKDKLLNGASITVVGKRYVYSKEGAEDKDEVKDGYCEFIEGGDVPEPPVGGGEYDSNVSWTLGANSYDNTSSGNSKQTATVNGVAVSNLLKLGKSSAAGSATLHIPAGTITLAFYAYAWNGTKATLAFNYNGDVLTTVDIEGNSGLTNNPPYTISTGDDEPYVLVFDKALPADIDLEVTTTATARVVLFGINAYDRVLENYTIDQINAVDAYIMEFDEGLYYGDLDFYVSDHENNCFSFNLDIAVGIFMESKTCLNGTYDLEIDKGYGFRDNERNYSDFTEGTLTLARVAGEDVKGYPLYSAIFEAKLANGEDFNHTFVVRAIGVDLDSEDWDEYLFEDQVPATKSIASSKAGRGKRAANVIRLR